MYLYVYTTTSCDSLMQEIMWILNYPTHVGDSYIEIMTKSWESNDLKND